MSALRSRFMDRLRVKGFSERTVENYVASVAGLARHYGRPPLDVSTEDIRAYLLFLLQQRRLAAATVNLHIAALKTFFALMAPGSTLMKEFTRVKSPRRVPMVLSREEVRRLIDATHNLKHKAMLMLLYSAGLRLMECVKLKPCHIESQRMKIRVEQGKGKRDRYTLLSRKTLEVLRSYYRQYRPRTWLFEGRDHTHVHPRLVGKVLNDAVATAGIHKRVHPHTLRHCFATHLMEAGVPIPLIQQLLGHSSIKTTMIYMHVGGSLIGKTISPMDMDSIVEEAVHA